MEPTRSQLGGVLLVLVALLGCVPAAGRVGTQDDVHSLQCVFNISFNEQLRGVVKVLMDGMLILEYDYYEDKVMYEKQEVMATNDSKDMKDTLKSMWDHVRKLLDLKTREILRGSSILQVGLECQSNANGSSCGPWEYRLGGQRCLIFDSKSGKYKADNSKGEEMKKKWENDEEMNEFLKKSSMGDLKRLTQVLVKRKKELETTAAPATASATATAPAPALAPAPAKTVNISPGIIIPWILILISMLITLGI